MKSKGLESTQSYDVSIEDESEYSCIIHQGRFEHTSTNDLRNHFKLGECNRGRYEFTQPVEDSGPSVVAGIEYDLYPSDLCLQDSYKDMSGLLAVPAIILKLRDWTPQLLENYGIHSGILCALLVVCWTQAKGLVDYRELISLIASLIACVVMVCSFISTFFCNYFSLLLLWVLSIFCVNRFMEAEERKTVKVEENAVKRGEDSGGSSALTGLVNAEKFVKLYQSWLCEEETVGTDSESIEEKICKLKIACKELRKVQISIDSLKTQVLSNFHPPMNDSRRVQGLIDKFEHTKAYMELRRYLLTMAQRQLSTFTEKGMALKVWMSEALEFHENLHGAACRSRMDVRRLSSLLMSIRKDSEVICKKLAEYVQDGQTLMASLQEISACSGIFHKALEGARSQKGGKKWHEILTVSITEEATQVTQRFSRLTRLNECYQAHLDGLLQFTAHRVGDSGSPPSPEIF